MNVSIFSKMDYENKSNWTLDENKPNSKPNKANLKRAKMNVNSLITKDYRKNDAFAVPENKPNSNPIQTQTKPIFKRDDGFSAYYTRDCHGATAAHYANLEPGTRRVLQSK